MQRDELQELWSSQIRPIERQLELNSRWIRDGRVRAARSTLSGYARRRVAELALGLLVAWAATSVWIAHAGEPRYEWIAGLLVAFAAGSNAFTVRLLVASQRLAYDGPVLAMQHALARLQALEFRALQWNLLGGVLVWLPAALVLFESVTSVPLLARVELPWLCGNLLFGVAAILVGRAAAKRWSSREDLAPWERRLADALGDETLREVALRLDELATFESDSAARG